MPTPEVARIQEKESGCLILHAWMRRSTDWKLSLQEIYDQTAMKSIQN